MPKDFYPDSEAEQLAFVDHLISQVSGAPADYGLTAAQVTQMQAAKTEAQTAFDENVANQIAARASKLAKDDKLDALEDTVRENVRIVQAHPQVTDEQRGKLQITVPDKVPTSAGAPDSVPGVRIDTAAPLQHIINFFTLAGDGAGRASRGKPKGVMGLEIWRKTGGEATMNEAEYQYLATDSESPYLSVFSPADGGKQAHYLVRWVSTSGEKGAWNLVSATVTTLA